MRADYINPSVYNRVYDLLTFENALALRLSLETGLRISDVLKIEVADLDGLTLNFVAKKTGKGGTKKISADLAKRLRSIAGPRWIFTGRGGDKPRTRQAVWKNVKNAAKTLGLTDNLSVHSARKTYSVEVFHKSGINAAQRELQHSRLDNTMLYVFSDLLTGGKSLRADDKILQDLYFMVKSIYDVVVVGDKQDVVDSDKTNHNM